MLFSRQSKQLPSIMNLLLLTVVTLKSVLWGASDKAEIRQTPTSHLHSAAGALMPAPR